MDCNLSLGFASSVALAGSQAFAALGGQFHTLRHACEERARLGDQGLGGLVAQGGLLGGLAGPHFADPNGVRLTRLAADQVDQAIRVLAQPLSGLQQDLEQGGAVAGGGRKFPMNSVVHGLDYMLWAGQTLIQGAKMIYWLTPHFDSLYSFCPLGS